MKTMKMKSATLALLVSTLATSSFAQNSSGAQQQLNPEQVKQFMHSMISSMTEAIMEAHLNVAAHPETAARLAAFKGNLYRALLKQGFTEQQAMQLTIEMTLPLAEPSISSK